MRPQRGPLVLLALGAGLAGLIAWQQWEAVQLRDALAQERARHAERDQLAAENRRLAAAQPSDVEMESLVNRMTQAEQLKAQLATLRVREEAAAKAAPVPAETHPSMLAAAITADRWQNAGQGTAEAAFETALWAAANGDLDALAGVLAFDSGAQQEAAALFERLPPGARTAMGTPERLVALLTAMDVPLGRAMIVSQQADANETSFTARLTDATGRGTTATFSLKPVGGRWQLQVPASAVKKYAAAWDGK